jgi:surfeit locus 1 family protein
MRFKPLPVLTLLTLASLCLLIVLGQWQWRRFDEKRAAQAAPAQAALLGPIREAREGAVFLYAVWEGRPGWRVLRGVRVGEPPTLETVLVDTGFIAGVNPPDAAAHAMPPPNLAPGLSLPGFWGAPGTGGAFTPAPDLSLRSFYAFDRAAMAQALNLGPTRPDVFLADYRGASGGAIPNPFAGSADSLPPERHLGYAVTWWGLALSLIAVYLGFHVRVGRLTLRPRS